MCFQSIGYGATPNSQALVRGLALPAAPGRAALT